MTTRTPTLRPRPCYIFDIDGTLADLTHRLHFIKDGKKDWNSFKHFCFADTPIKHMVDLAKLCSQQHFVVFMSGRNECQRPMTVEWIAKHFDEAPRIVLAPIYMRADGDYRSDDIIKAELLAEVRADGYQPIMAFDDRKRVVDMWRANGVPCAQVAPGDF
jgi:phosphoglycolate phosphatase-like HAD superfamily hydrolase